MALDVSVSAAALKAALGATRAAITARPTNPVWAFAHISADGGKIVITTTDGAQAFEAGAEAEVGDWGVILVDHARLSAVVGLFDGAVRLKYNERQKRVIIRCGKAEHVLPCGDVKDFPPIQWEPDGEPGHALVASGEAWARGFAVASHASQDPNRYGLNGVSVEKVDEESLRLVATDGSRLAWSDVDCGLPISAVKLPRRMLIPPGVARSMARAAGGGGLWGLRLGERSAAWGPVDEDGKPTEGLRVWFRMLEGEFPDYRLVMPPRFKRSIKVDSGALTAALKGVSLAAEDRNHSVAFNFEESRILLSTRNGKGSEASAEVEADLEGAPVRTGFNATYMAEALAFLGGGEVTLSMGDALDPCLLTLGPVAGVTSATLRGVVVMPMRLD